LIVENESTRQSVEVLRRLREAAVNQPEIVGVLVEEFHDYLVMSDDVASDVFTELTIVLQDVPYIRTPETYELLLVLRLDWEYFSPSQHEELRPILDAACYQISDSTGAMLIAEILGDRYCDERSLEQLVRLSATLRMPSRALMPHGLERFARTTTDAILRQRCLDRIRLLRVDPDPDVRREAQLSCDNLHRKS